MKILNILLLVGMASAQTISPIVGECGLKCKGQFTVSNETTRPEIVVIETYSFNVVDGHPVLRQLDANTTDAELSSTTTRLMRVQASGLCTQSLAVQRQPFWNVSL
jgi:hypothetical protein